MSLTEGQLFAGYTVVRLLGSGGMGEVYLARHPRLPRQDALKVLPESVSADDEFRTRFNREADLAATLWHPHVVGVHDRGEFEGRLWISMDYVEGTDAARLSRETYPDGMPAEEVVAIVSAVAEALDYAHGSGLLHRDVKPANILLTDPHKGARRILLADFGIARHTDDEAGLTRTNMTVGSVSYTAPEQLIGETIDGRADQYSLAATAFHLLTGRPPFVHSNPAVVIGRHLHNDPPKPSDSDPRLAAADPVITKAMAKDAGQRYSACSEFAAAFADSTRGAATSAAATPTPGAQTGAEPTTHLSVPPIIEAPAAHDGDPAGEPPAEPTTQHAAAPVVVSAWGTKEPAEQQVEPPQSPEPVPDARRVSPTLIVAAAIAAVGLIGAAIAFAIIASTGDRTSAPTAAPTTTAPYTEPTATRPQPTMLPTVATRTATQTVTVAPPPPAAPVRPAPQPPRSAGPVNLAPDRTGSVFVATVSGKTACQIRRSDVGCQVAFTVPTPQQYGSPANGVRVYSSGSWEWVVGDMGDQRFVTLEYGTTYQALGWTITPSFDGTGFTNTATGHGIFVSVDSVRPF